MEDFSRDEGEQEKVKELMPPERVRFLVSKEEWPVHICEINSLNDLYMVSGDSNFFQNPTEKDFEKVKEKLLYFDEPALKERIKRFIDSLRPQKIVLLVGPPAVGKSTLLIAFLERYLKEGGDNWSKIFFLNPIEEYLGETIEMGILRSKIAEGEVPSESALLVIDGLYREGEHEVNKIFELFKYVREEKFCLIATMRSHELEELMREREWKSFVNDVSIESIEPDKKAIEPILIKLIRYYKNEFKPFKNFSYEELENYFRSKEFHDIAQIIVNKSKGVIGYLTYLFKYLIKIGEFSKEKIEEFPEGMTELVKFIIERDFIVENDEVIPTLILFLAQQRDFLSFEFLRSFMEWGIIALDKGMKNEDFIIDIKFKIESLLKHFAFRKNEYGIAVYRLTSHWRDAINDFSENFGEWNKVKRHIDSRVKHFLFSVTDKLKNEELAPDPDNSIFIVIADIAKLLGGKEILKHIYTFLKKYERYRDTKEYAFLKEQFIFLGREQINKNLDDIYKDHFIINVENVKEILDLINWVLDLKPIDRKFCAELYFLESRCHLYLGNLEEASEKCERAIELDPNNVSYYIELGNMKEIKGKEARGAMDYPMAMIAYSEALDIYKKALNVVENLPPPIRGTKKEEENYLWWEIGRCRRRLLAIDREFNYIDFEELRNYLKGKFKRLYQNGLSFVGRRDYNGALRKFEEAKDFIMEYIDTVNSEEEKELLEKACGIVSELYRWLAICNEQIRNVKEASRYYLIYADLNDYAQHSIRLYLEYANKFRGWKLYEEAIYCLYKVLRFRRNDFNILSELADLLYRMGDLDQALKFLKKALEIEEQIIELPESDIDLIQLYEKEIGKRKIVARALCALCDAASISIEEENPGKLSEALYLAYLLLSKINPSILAAPPVSVSELDNLRKCCLSWALLLNAKNQEARKELEVLTQQGFEDKESLRKYTQYYKTARMRTLEEIRNPLDALLRIFSEAIYTMNVLHIKRKQGVKEDIARARAKLSAYWGWIGGRINRIFQDKKQRNKVDPDVAVKCFELSLKLRKRNKKSSNGIAWSLLFSGKADEAIKAFEYDLKEINKDNPASLIGIGRAYEEKGEYSVATRYLKDGAKLRFEKRYEEKPQLSVEVLARTIRRLERIAFLSNSMDERLKILKDALEVYGMLKEILGEVVLDSTQLQDLELVEDEQNLFPLRMNILKRYVSDLENALKTKNA